MKIRPLEDRFQTRLDTLSDVLSFHASRQPEKEAYTFLVDGESQQVQLTYRELDRKARAIAAMLQSVAPKGERALLIFPPGLDFIAAFYGCLYAGVIAVPTTAPRRNRPIESLKSILADAKPSVILTTGPFWENLQIHARQYSEFGHARILMTDKIDIHGDQALWIKWTKPDITRGDLAFLQYTSGSTAFPKGVMVSHGNLMHNLQMMKTVFGFSDKTVVVGWLPFYHDMGLVGNIFEPMYAGIHCVSLSPMAFLQKPIRWLQAITRFRGTACAGPNFAYDLCVQKVKPRELEVLDLSGWELACAGAEPVHVQTLERFAAYFQPCGFRREAFYPCYGMAEATLFLSGGDRKGPYRHCLIQKNALSQDRIIEAKAGDPESKAIVSCGKVWENQKVVIVDPKTSTLSADGSIGEIWVRGASVAQGYWNRPEETKKTFQATLNSAGNDLTEQRYLRTGDLGFMKEGELYITGRLKELMIIRGRNYYPQDIEKTVEESHPALRIHSGAVFSVESDNQEKLIVTQEIRREARKDLDLDEVIQSIRQRVSEFHELGSQAILLLREGSVPKTSSGKIKRLSVRTQYLEGSLEVLKIWEQGSTGFPQEETDHRGPSSTGKDAVSSQMIRHWLVEKIARRLNVQAKDIDVHAAIDRYGLDSLEAVNIISDLERWLGRELSPTLIYNYPSIQALSDYLSSQSGSSSLSTNASGMKATARQTKTDDIAVIGMGCRFPGAHDLESFGKLLKEGIDAIGNVPAQRWNPEAFYQPEPGTPGKMNTCWGGFIDAVDRFDAHFFGISRREAEKMDPQQRLILEVAWEALENAGMAPDQLSGSLTGVFIGICHSNYEKLILRNPDQVDAYSVTGTALSIAANRLSYFLNLKGPSLAIDTACSSSLVAIHQACQSLRGRETDLCLVGGVNIILTPEGTISFSQARMMASDGRCKTFDADADGYSRGEGCGVIVLKRLDQAIKNHDRVLAVIKGSAVNQDGASNGLTAPHGPSQTAVIRQALKNARVLPDQISYVEAHGTGTSLGDPIEMDSIKEALMEGRQESDICYVGSVKTNIGHLEAAAGIAGVIKVVLAMQHGEIPAHLHLKKLNPLISLEKTPFSIPTQRQSWPRGERKRLAGVSSFGFGGTNGHVILEEAPMIPVFPKREGWHIWTVSAKTKPALTELARKYEEYLYQNADVEIADVCFTANTGRSHFPRRLAFVVQSRTDLKEQLRVYLKDNPMDHDSSLETIQKEEGRQRQDLLMLKRDYLSGENINWKDFYEGYVTQRVALPTYPFQRQRYWIEAADQEKKEIIPVHSSRLSPALENLPEIQGRMALASVPFEKREKMIEAYLIECVARQLGTSPSEIDPQRPLIQLGLDSIMALLLCDDIKKNLGLNITQAEFMKESTVSRLTKVLQAQFSHIPQAVSPSASESVSVPTINPLGQRDNAPLSYAQKKLWFLDQLYPGNHIYNIPIGVRFRGDLNVDRLKEALSRISLRQESLRTTFVAKDGVPCQVIHPKQDLAFQELDLQNLPDDARSEKADQLIKEQARQPFDLTQGQLWRTFISRLNKDEHMVLFVFHHIIFDGWSLGVFFKELSCVYQDLVNRSTVSLSPLEMQYRDFAIGQEESSKGHGWREHLQYWRDKLQGVPLTLDLPFDNPRPPVQTYHGHREILTMDAKEKRRIEKVCREQGITMFNWLLAAFGFLISYHSRQNDFAIAVPIADRGRMPLKSLIGLLVNFLPLRCARDPKKTFLEYGHDVQAMTQEALHHQHVPFEEILTALNKPRDLRMAPLSQVVFNFLQIPADLSRWPDADLSFFEVETGIAQTDLALLVKEEQGCLRLSMEYNTDLFKQSTIRKWMGQYQQLLRAAVKDPGLTMEALLDQLGFIQQEDKSITTNVGPHPFALEQSNLTRNQLIIWAGQKLDVLSPVYNSVITYTIHEFVDRKHLETAFQRIVDERDSLRTIIEEVDGVPRQKVHDHVPCDIHYVDFSGAADPEVEAQQWSLVQSKAPFRLNERTFYCALLKITDEKFVWFISQHHIITDGWSQLMVWQDLLTYYRLSVSGELQGKTAKVSFQEYLNFEKEFLKSERYDRARAYWDQQLERIKEGGGGGALEVWGQKRQHQTTQVERVCCQLGQPLTQRLNEIISAQGSSSHSADAVKFHFFLALYAVFLARVSGKKTVAMGIPIHNRRSKKFKETMGLIMQMVPLWIEINENDSFEQLIKQVANTTFKAIQFGQYIVPSSLRQPVYDAILNYHPWWGEPVFLEKRVTGKWILPEHAFESLTLNIHTFEAQVGKDEDVRFDFDFNEELFEPQTRRNCARYFLNLAEAALKGFHQPIGNLRLLSHQEIRQQLVDFNQTAKDYDLTVCLHQLFERQAAQTPHAIALIFEGQSLTYQELNQQANALAHHLKSLGVKTEDLIGICVERSFEMVVGLMGILKAGASYIPLDPTYPRDRLEFMLRDSRVPVVLTQGYLLDRFPSNNARIICLDEIRLSARADNPVLEVTAQNLAYCIYTSGSTGKPKGAMNTHQGIVNRLLWMQETYQLTARDKVLQKTPFSFDVSVWELFWPLIVGAQMVIAKPEGHKDGLYLRNLIIEQEITTLHFVPSMLNAFLDVEGLDRVHSVRNVICSGEALSVALQERFFTKMNARLHNLYGPTEAAVDVTYWPCQKNSPLATVPLGYPIANIRIYILDQHQQLLPVGMAGEIHIGGVGVGRGYLNRPELTQEKFIPDPFSANPSSRLYKTGDLGRYMAGGIIEYLGRMDNQVKIRGFRIELGEIESTLMQHPGIKDAVVNATESHRLTTRPYLTTAQQNAEADKQLVAYVVFSNGQLTMDQLKDHLGKKLPAYMVPSYFVPMERLPLLPNGKVDRKSLPAPDGERSILVSEYVAPQTPLEKMVVSIWEEVLGVKRIGLNDNFFDLGGHSLLLTQLLYRVNQEFQREVSMIRLFQNPTVAGMAAILEGGKVERASDSLRKVNWVEEAVLDPAVSAAGVRPDLSVEAKKIFLTGASGFVGAFLLNELLEKTTADIYCLVRAKNSQQALERIRESLNQYSLNKDESLHRIIPVAGDLAEINLGLGVDLFGELAREIDCIYHNGALVNFALPYDVIKRANVGGTHEILKMAARTKVKPTHYISTLGIFSNSQRLYDENSSIDQLDHLAANGYIASKWVAEKLVMAAQERGLPCSIYRLGQITGSSRTGACRPEDFLHNMLIGCDQIGFLPEEILDLKIDLTPVDYVAQAIVALSRQPSSVGQVSHLINPQRVSYRRIFEQLGQFGRTIQPLPYEQWFDKVNQFQQDPYSPFYRIMPILNDLKLSLKGLPQWKVLKKFILSRMEYKIDCARTVDILARHQLRCPRPSDELMNLYFQFLKKNHLLKADSINEKFVESGI